MKRWRRPLILILLLLLAGGVVNVVIAWSIAGFGEAPEFALSVSYSNTNGRETTEIILGVADRTSVDVAAPWHIGLAPPQGGFATIRAGFGHWNCWEAEVGGGRTAATAAFGWPFPALRTVVVPAGFASSPAPRPALPAPGILTDLGMFARSSGAIPIDPILLGLLYNTLIYAAALVIPLSFFPVRRWRRRRRGRCVRCNYDLRGIDGACPECGGRHAG